MSAHAPEFAQIRVGDRARLWLGPPKMGGLHYGEVVGVDNLGHSGIQIRFDAPVKGEWTCYATHAEVEVRREHVVRYGDGSPSREVRVEWLPERCTTHRLTNFGGPEETCLDCDAWVATSPDSP